MLLIHFAQKICHKLQVYLLGLLSVFHFCYRNSSLYEAFGFHASKPTIIGFIIVFQYVMAPYDELVAFLMTVGFFLRFSSVLSGESH